MKKAWIVAIIFSLQTVLLGAAPICGCLNEAQTQALEVGCCAAEADTCSCCGVLAQPDDSSVPAVAASSVTIHVTATPSGMTRIAISDRPTSLKLTAEPHPTGLWSEFVCAERAPPLS